MKSISSIKRALTVSGLAFAGLFTSGTVHAAQLTYDLRIVGSADPHSLTGATPGQVVTVDLYAVLADGDGNHANDGFTTTYGSFLSSGNALGNFRGDPNYSSTTVVPNSQINNVSPFNYTQAGANFAQSGFAQDLNGDGFNEIVGGPDGPLTPLITVPYFVAQSNNGAASPEFGTGTGTPGDTTEFLIGQTTFTIAGNAQPAATVNLAYHPYIKTDGSLTSRKNQQFEIDGVAINLLGSDTTNMAEIGATIQLAPEPSAVGMLLLGAVGLVGFRRSAFRRSIA